MDLKEYQANISLAKTLNMFLPGRIIFGLESVDQIASILGEINANKTIVFTDRNIAKLGMMERVLAPVKKAADNYEVYDEIEKEPTYDTVEKAVEYTRRGMFDSVVAVGGGSVLDTAKMAAVLATNKGQVRDHVNPFEDKLSEASLPKVLLPTTAGTGSETSSDAVVIDSERGVKTFCRSTKIYPTAAIVDPILTTSCPPKVTSGCGMDALSHLVEALVSNDSNPLSTGMALEGIKLIFRSLRKAYHNGRDLAARWDVSFAAMIGGLMFGTAPSAYPGHAVSEVVGPQHQVPHGVVCAITLPYIMEFNASACSENLALISRAIGFDASGGSERELAKKAVDAVLQLMMDMEMPLSLSEIGVSKNELTKYRDIYLNHKLYDLKTYNPRLLTPQNVDILLERMWKGVK